MPVHEPEWLKPEAIGNNHTEIYVDGPDNLRMLLREINNARHFINIQVMLFYSDEAGMQIAKALAAKSREGIEVRVMCDSDMSNISRAIETFRTSGISNFSYIADVLSEAGVKFVPSDKESFTKNEWKKERNKLLKNGVPEEFIQMQDFVQKGVVLNANVFDHRKIMIFDGETAIASSINIGNNYLYEEDSKPDNEGGHWHDCSLLIKGPCASLLNKHFASKWMTRGGEIFDYTRHYRTRENYGTDKCTVYNFFPGMGKNHIRDYYLNKIKSCKGEFIIENPYINDNAFFKALAALPKAQASKISIINPYSAPGNDYAQNEATIRCKMGKAFKKGVKLYHYSKRMLHWKVALDVANDEVFMGSYNLNHRSAMHDFELNVLVESKQLSSKIKAILEDDLAISSRVTDPEKFYKYPWLHPSCYFLRALDYFE